MGYAAEYLSRGTFAALTMGFSLLMSICCILYHVPFYMFYKAKSPKEADHPIEDLLYMIAILFILHHGSYILFAKT